MLFNLETHTLNFVTCRFSLPNPAFELLIYRSEFVARKTELVTRMSELVSQNS